MWELAALFTSIAVGLSAFIGGYETYALKTKRVPTITNLIRTHPHAFIVISGLVAILTSFFGYVLGQGGP